MPNFAFVLANTAAKRAGTTHDLVGRANFSRFSRFSSKCIRIFEKISTTGNLRIMSARNEVVKRLFWIRSLEKKLNFAKLIRILMRKFPEIYDSLKMDFKDEKPDAELLR